MFDPVGYDNGSDARKSSTASDGVAGQPPILLVAQASSGTRARAENGGEVPAGTTAGGREPALRASTRSPPATREHENDDFTESKTDLFDPGVRAVAGVHLDLRRRCGQGID